MAFEDGDAPFIDGFEIECRRAIDDDEIVHRIVCDDGIFTAIDQGIGDIAQANALDEVVARFEVEFFSPKDISQRRLRIDLFESVGDMGLGIVPRSIA